ncbi:YbaB/EbfC family nucleoid-associated protein [Glycomyces harbinensis]|uniref:YbaB/EbfC DNA-binding family protein n=1 Tax=Glycomyces harbinensis TaxID=58114 RepID=A0A1G7DLM8_9ACTN|nr:YbaB/EbfC family nucleoid-associated protein [Glycomyces harbinensis]SDE52444.1 YbaB/EbfC DNA-binding family protein [Glycomyces harbinensis]
MVGSIPDPEASREHLQAWKGRIDQLAEDTRAMSDQFQDLKVTASDPDRNAEVTIDSSGNLVDIVLSERTRRISTEDVSQAILQAFRAARVRIAERSAEIVAETMGADSPAGRAIAERVRGQLMPHTDEER